MSCFKCGTADIGNPGTVSFNLKGRQFKVFKDGFSCAPCSRDVFIEKYKELGEFIEKMLGFPGGEMKIDWNFYFEHYRAAREGTYSAERLKTALSILLSLGVFSLKKDGNWEIIADGPIGLNPRLGGLSYLYFARKEDAIEYARLKYANTCYGWVVCRYDEVINMSEVLKRE